MAAWPRKQEALAFAIEETERFLRRAKRALAEAKECGPHTYCPSIIWSSAKRSSLDLTRALASLRKAKV